MIFYLIDSRESKWVYGIELIGDIHGSWNRKVECIEEKWYDGPGKYN